LIVLVISSFSAAFEPAEMREYVVNPGDTLGQIQFALKGQGVDVSRLTEWNPGLGTQVKVGQIIRYMVPEDQMAGIRKELAGLRQDQTDQAKEIGGRIQSAGKAVGDRTADEIKSSAGNLANQLTSIGQEVVSGQAKIAGQNEKILARAESSQMVTRQYKWTLIGAGIVAVVILWALFSLLRNMRTAASGKTVVLPQAGEQPENSGPAPGSKSKPFEVNDEWYIYAGVANESGLFPAAGTDNLFQEFGDARRSTISFVRKHPDKIAEAIQDGIILPYKTVPAEGRARKLQAA